MKKTILNAFLLLGCLIWTLSASSQNQDRMVQLANKLDSLAGSIPGLNERTNISLRNVPVHEYVRAIGLEHRVNVYIADRPDLTLTNNLVNEPVKTVYLFVCKTFNYTIEPIGTILRFIPYSPPSPQIVAAPPKPLKITFEDQKISLDLKDDSLFQVIREISRQTGQKLIASSNANRPVTVYVPNAELPLALDLLAKANDFQLKRNRKGYFVFKDLTNTATEVTPAPSGSLDFSVEAFSDADVDFVQIEAEDADLKALLQALFQEAGVDYFLFGEIEGKVTVRLEASRIGEVLKYLFQGTDYTYRKEGGLYLIGGKELEGLQAVEIVKLKFRPTYQALDLIPGAQGGGNTRTNTRPNRPPQQPQRNNRNQLNNIGGNQLQQGVNNGFPGSNTFNNQGYGGSIFGEAQAARITVDGVELVEYPELNRIILKGPSDRVQELAMFLREIDRPIPMVKVEMIVVEVNNNVSLSTGIRAGLGTAPDSGQKVISPGLDYTLNGSEVNSLLTGSNVPFLQSLGTLSPNFYMQLKAQEANGNLKIRMTPVLSMLNGREASLVIGQTQYYLLETTTSATGAVNNFQQFSQQFTQIEANIALTIRPFISDDNMVTLDVAPDFSTPLGSFDPDVPPTIATRRFDSSVRVKNGETFVLGGLTRQESSRSATGLPWVSRLPIIKWFTGNNSRSHSESSLIIYLTPTIYYY